MDGFILPRSSRFLKMSSYYFNPPYSPDINPIERVWQFIKDQLRWLNLKNLDELRRKVDEVIQSITPNQIASLTSFDFILTALK